MIDVLRKIWAGGMVEHHGRFYDFDLLQLSPAPPGPIPIYLGGTSPAALRRAARLGDGWLGSGHDPGEIPGLVQELARLRVEAGREGEPFDFVAAVTAPASADLFRRLEDQGVTSIISYPPVFTLGPGTSLEQKRSAFEQYADDVIARMR
jgi:alkanesulfonate monooxygenase SsuD/methylene tetrahydromethanopterin reductase-like flavin-dependent oxidoreductase (luciferase family)